MDPPQKHCDNGRVRSTGQEAANALLLVCNGRKKRRRDISELLKSLIAIILLLNSHFVPVNILNLLSMAFSKPNYSTRQDLFHTRIKRIAAYAASRGKEENPLS